MARTNDFTDLGIVAQVMDIPPVLEGKRVAITGHMGRPRQEIISLIKSAGGIYHDTLKVDTNILLTNEDWTNIIGKTSTKYMKARRYGVSI